MDEYIEREAAQTSCRKYSFAESYDAFAVDCILKSIPAADVSPVRHGRWERVIPSKSSAKWSTKVSCSSCHSAGYTHHKYCPNCGAKMDGGADNG